MPKFCSKCGAPLPENTKFCQNCGHPVTPAANEPQQPQAAHPQNQPAAPAPAPAKGSGNPAAKIGLAVLALALIGFGGYKFYLSRQVPAKAPAPTKQTEKAQKEEPAPEKEDTQSNTSLDAAKKAAAEHGFTGKVLATSYGHNDKGFLFIEEYGDKGMMDTRIIEIDTQNNRAAWVHVNSKELENLFRSFINSSRGTLSLTARFEIENDSHDRDGNAGSWRGTTHTLPVLCKYTINSGTVEPGMLTTGASSHPYTMKTPLYEQKNVDLANLLLEDLYVLLDEAQKNNVKI